MDAELERILRILPQRPPFLFVDRIVELSPRQSIRTLKCVSFNEPVVSQYASSNTAFPNSLIVEAMFQALQILVSASEPFDRARKTIYLLGVNDAKFRRSIDAGECAEIVVEISSRRSNIWHAKATASVGENQCAHAELLAAVADRASLP